MLKSLHSRQNDVFLRMLRSKREAQRLRQLDLAIRLGRGQATVELWAWLNALEIDFVTFTTELDQELKASPVPDPRFRATRRNDSSDKRRA